MLISTMWTGVFTLVFTATGAYALVRFAGLSSGTGAPGDRLVELFHLLMSLAMVAMALAWTGGPGTASGIVQIVVFGLFTLWFGARLRRRGRIACAFHVVMGVAMTWMVAAMPLMMGTPADAQAAGAHAEHGGDAGGMGDVGAMGAMAPDMTSPPAWVTAVSLVFVALLLVAAAWWATRLTRSDDTRSDDTRSDDTRSDDTRSDDTRSDDTRSDDTRSDDGAGRTGGVGTATRTSWLTVARADAACHAVMSLGMAAMLALML